MLLMLEMCCCAADAGREALARYLSGNVPPMVLVVIDDAGDAAQLNNLLPPCQLHAESLIIITSRKKHVLDARCAKVSEVQPLPEGRSEQHFRAWAFAAGPPVWDTSKLVPELVACCGRLPLALKVGSACDVHHAYQHACMRCDLREANTAS